MFYPTMSVFLYISRISRLSKILAYFHICFWFYITLIQIQTSVFHRYIALMNHFRERSERLCLSATATGKLVWTMMTTDQIFQLYDTFQSIGGHLHILIFYGFHKSISFFSYYMRDFQTLLSFFILCYVFVIMLYDLYHPFHLQLVIYNYSHVYKM